MTPAAAGAVSVTLLAVLACVTAGVTVRARRHTGGTVGFFAGGRGLSARQNGFALAGGHLPAVGVAVLSGHEVSLWSVGSLVAWVPVLLLAGPLRNAGRFTLADVPAYRLSRRPPVRVAGAVSTAAVSVLYLTAQLAGAGALVSLLPGIGPGTVFPGLPARVAAISAAGALVVLCVAAGGMRAVTRAQIVTTALVLTAGVVMTGLAPGRLGPGPGPEAAGTLAGRLDLVSLALALALGTAGLPHVAGRILTVPDARTARTSVNWAIALAGGLLLMTLTLGEHLAGRTGGDAPLVLAAAVACAAVPAAAGVR
ncbi:hypothetical protein [Actinomadura sp. DC4]|uniref:sodium:solute symporter family transporter n=1 Tax=Actinomadura sp. DC4 TaxID=3055069 RepID=UPI0025AF7A57|nr:hypothetical protein [Actinomadura sp. DC4]MDN3351289.1 hypothetical protein [Actinomadura sp. DC4]